jgi:hypothetical protein
MYVLVVGEAGAVALLDMVVEVVEMVRIVRLLGSFARA